MDKNLKIAVYTCITGGYDKLALPLLVDSRIDYFCFTDNDAYYFDDFWSVKLLNLPDLDNKDVNRYVKMHPHIFLSDYDITVYIDGNIEIVGELYELLSKVDKLDDVFFAYRHSERNCIYSEGAACSYYSHDWIWNIAKKMRDYSESHYPMNNGLVSANVLIRKKNLQMSTLMDAWWLAYQNGVKRDQLSLPYVSWKLNIPIHYLGINNFTYFNIVGHSKKRSRSIKITLRKYINRAIALFIPYHVLFSVPSKISRKKPFLSI
ncbi:MAG: hypothetical protein RLZZ66_1986 [Pseudomonadota bacterium]|jgi:hypothetical protein